MTTLTSVVKITIGGNTGDDEAQVYKELCQAVEEWIKIYKEDGGSPDLRVPVS
jgi:hypothetical protein